MKTITAKAILALFAGRPGCSRGSAAARKGLPGQARGSPAGEPAMPQAKVEMYGYTEVNLS